MRKMKKMVLVIAALMFGQLLFADALQDALGGGLNYSIGEGWSITTSSRGPRVYCSSVAANSERCISTAVSGPGAFRFRTSGSLWYEGTEFLVKVDENTMFSKKLASNGYSQYWDEVTVEIPVLTKGGHNIVWSVKNSSANSHSCSVYISNVEWIPAPANVTVAFDGEGGLMDGEESVEKSFATGEPYGVLPTPIREGRTFEGWFTAGGELVVASDYVIPNATNLSARWSVKLDGVDCEVVKGNDGIYTDKDGIVFPAEESDSYDWMPENENNYIEIECNGEALVSFDWVFEAEPKSDARWPWAEVEQQFYVDGALISTKTRDVEYNYWYEYDDIGIVKQRSPVRVVLTQGTHKLRWQTITKYNDGLNVRSSLEKFVIEPGGMLTDVVDWVKSLVNDKIWNPDSLERLRDVYGARIAANPNDYESRVIRAAIRIALVAENEEIRAFINECGYAIADYTMKVSGEFCGLENLAPANDTVDRLSPEALTALDDALADLNAIPENWNGSLELSSKTYEALNEPVYVDLAEITVMKAAIESARATVLLVKGYDFTMDYVAASNAVANATYVWDVLEQVPDAGYIRDANVLLESKEWFRMSLQHIRRADQIILWRSNPLPHFFEYDLVDASDLARTRLYLEQLIGSLDHPETIDLPYFVDRFGYKGETLPFGMFRQLYLGAIFAGRITQDLVPNVQIAPPVLCMDTVEDTTLGGLLPDFGFEEFATLFPCSQYWPLSLYDEIRPESQLLKGQTLTVADEALCDGTLEYAVNFGGLRSVTAQCVIDGLAVDTISVGGDKEGGERQERSVAVQEGSEYELVFTAEERDMRARRQIFEIQSVPEITPVGDGTYSEVANGVTWNFTVSDDEATVTGVSGTVGGDIVLPEKLGGRRVAAIAEDAFRRSPISSVTISATVKNIGESAFEKCESLHLVRFLGEEPMVGEDAFNQVAATVMFKEGTVLSGLDNGKWQGMSVQYVENGINEDLRVRASLADGYEFDGMATLSLSVAGDATIYFTMNGAEPTSKALVYVSPISVSITTRIKYFAVDNKTGESGPVGSVLLKLVEPSFELLSNSEYAKTVNGIAWTYQELNGGIRLTGNNGTAAGGKVTGEVVIPEAVNWQPVTAIGAGLFAACDGITSVTLPSTVTEIESGAFRGCTHLKSVSLPEGLLSIGDGAFERCTSLSDVVIPASVENIGYFAFRDCLRLESVTLKGDPPRQDLGVYMGVPAFTVISGRLGSATAIVYAEVTNETESITVPEGWLDEIATMHDKPAGFESYQEAFKARYGDDLKAALAKPTGKRDLKGNPLYVWQDYVAGTNPLDEEDAFTATITMEDGVPVIRWSPELSAEKAALRKYTVYGATALGGTWVDVSDKTDAERHELGYQFFRVSVKMK